MAPVAEHGARRGGLLELDLHVALVGGGAHALDGLGHDQVDEHGLAGRGLFGLDARQVEQVVDDPADPERLGVDAAGQALGHGGVLLGRQRLRQQSDRTHRGLQLVAHVGDEVTSDLFEAPALGHVVDGGDDPQGAPTVVDELRGHGQGAARRAVEVEGAVCRALLPRIGEQVDHGLRRQCVTVPAAHEPDGAGVAEHDRAVLVADDDPLGQGVEGASQPDGVRRRLGHGLSGAVGDELEVVQSGLDPHAVVLGGRVDAEARRQSRQSLLQ